MKIVIAHANSGRLYRIPTPNNVIDILLTNDGDVIYSPKGAHPRL